LRDEHRAEYIERFEMMPEQDRTPLTRTEYLEMFGQTHSHTNRLQGQGLCPTINGETLCFDTFDTKFRELGYVDWAIKYDPDHLEEILALNAQTDSNRKVVNVIGSYRFILDKKYIQPMAIYDQLPGDRKELEKVTASNKQMKQGIIDRMDEQQKLIEPIFELEEFNDTLLKHVITDSTGQHKDHKSKQRIAAAKFAEIGPGEDYQIIEDEINY
jgi:hypothetical protein